MGRSDTVLDDTVFWRRAARSQSPIHSGLDTEIADPPAEGRAPGWDAGVVVGTAAIRFTQARSK
jgi:hypothetical protein